jgi:uncharacterized protein Smg (DUF494 family)
MKQPAHTHPVEAAINRMSRRDQKLANELLEAGFSDEDLYAALPNPGVDALLRPKAKKTKQQEQSK